MPPSSRKLPQPVEEEPETWPTVDEDESGPLLRGARPLLRGGGMWRSYAYDSGCDFASHTMVNQLLVCEKGGTASMHPVDPHAFSAVDCKKLELDENKDDEDEPRLSLVSATEQGTMFLDSHDIGEGDEVCWCRLAKPGVSFQVHEDDSDSPVVQLKTEKGDIELVIYVQSEGTSCSMLMRKQTAAGEKEVLREKADVAKREQRMRAEDDAAKEAAVQKRRERQEAGPSKKRRKKPDKW
tara:strand:+ start:119 stop:835 length:717 start_codon:yes stop_codon:yes gene_type:complete